MIASLKAVSTAAVMTLAALPMLRDDAATAAPILRHGTFKFTGTIMIKSSLPANAIITAQISINGAGERFINKTAQIKHTGSTAVMTAVVPYAWELNSLAGLGSQVFITFSASAQGAAFTQVRVTVPMPADGATTTVAIPASI
jgi:hypothetical protein